MSSRHATQTAQAFVLHGRAYRNTSLIIEVFTFEAGRLSLLAKAARTPQSPFYGILQPFMPLFLQYGGQGELPVLYKAESTTVGLTLQGEQLFNGLYLNELLVRLLHKHDAHPELFDHYHSTLQQLAQHTEQDVVLRMFELQLLEELGYGMNLSREVNQQQAVEPGQSYHYIIEQGPVCAGTGKDNSLTVQGDTLLALANRQLHTAAQRQQAKLLMRTVMDYYLGQQPLKARELYRQFRV